MAKICTSPSRWIAVVAVSLCVVHAAEICRAETPEICGRPAALHDGWAIAAPEQEHLNSALTCGIHSRLDGWKEAVPHGVVVARRGVLVYERYFAGPDTRLGKPLGIVTFDAGTKHDMRSVTKSVVSLLVGIAVDRGWLPSLDAPVFSFFPEHDRLRTQEKDRITLRHLLTMSSGLAWNETNVPSGDPENTYARMAMATVQGDYFVLAQPLTSQPGEVFNYNSGTTNLLGVILQRVSGLPLDTLAKEVLFNPLGIEEWSWDGDAGFYPSGAAGLRLRPRDFAKIGQLVLQHGVWNGRKVVSSAWMDQSIAPLTTGKGALFDGPERIASFGYLWWLGHVQVDGREHDLVATAGRGGQRLFIVPDLELVVAVTAGAYNSSSSGLTGITVLNDFILPATIKH